MPSSPQELLLALAAPVLAVIILLCWLLLRVRSKGATNLHLRFLGLSLDIRSCEYSEAQCRRAMALVQSPKERNGDKENRD